MEQNRKPRNKHMYYGQLIYEKGGKNMQQRKDSLFDKSSWEKWAATCKKTRLEHFHIPYTKIKSKWIKDPNVIPDTIKLLEANIGRIHFDIKHSNIFWICLLREIKAKTNKWGLIKLQSFCTSKETINKTKRQPTEWEKYLQMT